MVEIPGLVEFENDKGIAHCVLTTLIPNPNRLDYSSNF